MNQTENLKLNKYDPIADAKQPFSISDGLNANWDIIDENFKNLNNTSQSTQNDLQILEDKFTNKLNTIHVDYSKGESITVKSYYCPADGVITGVMTDVQDALGLRYIYDKSERSTIKGKELTQLLKKNGII